MTSSLKSPFLYGPFPYLTQNSTPRNRQFRLDLCAGPRHSFTPSDQISLARTSAGLLTACFVVLGHQQHADTLFCWRGEDKILLAQSTLALVGSSSIYVISGKKMPHRFCAAGRFVDNIIRGDKTSLHTSYSSLAVVKGIVERLFFFLNDWVRLSSR